MTANQTSLRDLAAKWRKDAAYSHSLGDRHDAGLIQSCADELEAALAARAEPQAGESDPFKRIPGLHGVADAADYLAKNPGDEYAQRRLRERIEAFSTMHGLAPSPASLARPEAQGEEIVGHKTLRDESGHTYHEPLTRAEADQLIRNIEEQEARRNGLMPDERAAIAMFFDAWVRLKDFGWREAIYCPKDGSMFKVIEPGSTGIFDCAYEGEWPNGGWWIHADGDSVPSHPALFKPKDAP